MLYKWKDHSQQRRNARPFPHLPTIPGYAAGAVAHVDLMPGMKSVVHTFTMTSEGEKIVVRQLIVVNRDESRVWYVTTYSVEPLRDAQIERLHSVVASALSKT